MRFYCMCLNLIRFASDNAQTINLMTAVEIPESFQHIQLHFQSLLQSKNVSIQYFLGSADLCGIKYTLISFNTSECTQIVPNKKIIFPSE